jgi:hypothetical protein
MTWKIIDAITQLIYIAIEKHDIHSSSWEKNVTFQKKLNILHK